MFSNPNKRNLKFSLNSDTENDLDNHRETYLLKLEKKLTKFSQFQSLNSSPIGFSIRRLSKKTSMEINSSLLINYRSCKIPRSLSLSRGFI